MLAQILRGFLLIFQHLLGLCCCLYISQAFAFSFQDHGIFLACFCCCAQRVHCCQFDEIFDILATRALFHLQVLADTIFRQKQRFLLQYMD